MDKAFRKYNRDLYKFNRRSREYNFNKRHKSPELRSAFRRYNKDYEKYQRELRKQQYQKYGAKYFVEEDSSKLAQKGIQVLRDVLNSDNKPPSNQPLSEEVQKAALDSDLRKHDPFYFMYGDSYKDKRNDSTD
tara:strand:- start:119 stop:517 length:399 start_codon:yes stop_codon:yes gene_type:complete